MNGDLISRGLLLEVLRYNAAKHTDENGETRQLIAIDINKMIEYVEQMPTAFDVEKVEKALQRYAKSDICDRYDPCPYKHVYDIKCENCGALGALEIFRNEGEEPTP